MKNFQKKIGNLKMFKKNDVFVFVDGFWPYWTSDSDSSRFSASVLPSFVDKYPFWTTLGEKGKRKR